MNGKDLVDKCLRGGIPLWRIEDELDWQENAAAAQQTALPEVQGARVKSLWRSLLSLFICLFH